MTRAKFTLILSGFTLIELLVVMAILSLLLLVVGPLSSQQIARSEAQAEWLEIKSVISQLPDIAYAKGDDFNLTLDGSKLSIMSSRHAYQASYDFDHIFFMPQQLTINAHGFPSQNTISLLVRKQERELSLKPFSDKYTSRNVTGD